MIWPARAGAKVRGQRGRSEKLKCYLKKSLALDARRSDRWDVRPAQLRSLLNVLRSAGVAEYSQTTKGATYTIRMGPPVIQAASPRRPRDAPASGARNAVLAELGVTDEQAQEILSSVA